MHPYGVAARPAPPAAASVTLDAPEGAGGAPAWGGTTIWVWETTPNLRPSHPTPHAFEKILPV